jgi:hypothetical protein
VCIFETKNSKSMSELDTKKIYRNCVQKEEEESKAIYDIELKIIYCSWSFSLHHSHSIGEWLYRSEHRELRRSL